MRKSLNRRVAFVIARRVKPVLLALATALGLCACANPGSGYARQHPELSPAHRQIFLSQRIPSGDEVAGLTREQVTIAMGGAPTTYDKADGEDVWIYVRKKPVARDPELGTREPNSSIDRTRGFTDPAGFDAEGGLEERTSVFFRGDRATHARVTDERG